MTVHPDFPLQSDTTVPGLAFAPMRMVMLKEARDRGLSVLEDSATHVAIRTEHGLISIADAGNGIELALHATRPEWLYTLKERLVERIGQALPDAVRDLRWSGASQAGGLPPNFQFATILDVFPVGSSFLRARAKLPDLSAFGDDAIHFRLVLPPDGLEPVEWPTISEIGATVWPQGERALHRLVYTVSWIDPSVRSFEFDVFLHEGGRVTNWAQSVEPGAHIGIMGPAGGGIPVWRKILLYADETAFPAAARTLETLPDDTQGHVALLAEDGAHCAYPVTAPAGVSVTWRAREDAVSLADLALAARAEFPDHFLWFACKRRDVLRVSAAFRESQGNPEQAYISAYWSQT